MSTSERKMQPKVTEVRLEFLRPGPQHGQLLSPLTPYITVCNDVDVATIYVALEHWELLSLLQGLSYQLPPSQRAAELRRLGQLVGGLLATVPKLSGYLNGPEGRLVHLRMTLGGNELAMLPWEASLASGGLPGSGQLLLQARPPVVLTRDTRRSARIKVDITQRPRVLLIAAAPAPHTPVPLRAHVLALYQALRPFEQAESAEERAGRTMAEMLTVLPNATLEQISTACAAADPPYTHIQILAHGAQYQELGQARFGIALHRGPTKAGHPDERDIISPERLAMALRSKRDREDANANAQWLSLLCCDGGNSSDVILPLGSIAQELHEAGIPWVIASQLPLSAHGSVRIAANLYRRLFLGEDPRWVLYELRRDLARSPVPAHDWMSLVVYASVPDDLDAQVRLTQSLRAYEALSVIFNLIDNQLFPTTDSPFQFNTPNESTLGQIRNRYEVSIKKYQETLKAAVGEFGSAEPETGFSTAQAEALERLAGCERNRAFLLHNPHTPDWRFHLEQARLYYSRALVIAPQLAWLQEHYLFLSLLVGESNLSLHWFLAYHSAQKQANSTNTAERAWGKAGLAELHFLATKHRDSHFDAFVMSLSLPLGVDQNKFSTPESRHTYYCETLYRELNNSGEPRTQAMLKLRRQLRRYAQTWSDMQSLAKQLLKQ